MLSSMLAFLEASPRLAAVPGVNLGVVITELVLAALLLVLMFFFRRRFLKILCACGSEVCLFLACKLFFGPDHLVTWIMCWITAAAACIVTVAIVNRINWNDLRGKRDP